MTTSDLLAETVDIALPTPPPIDPERLIESLADIHAEAATAASVEDDVDRMRQALVRCWKLADAAIRQARGW